MSNSRRDDENKTDNKYKIKKQYNNPEGDVVFGNKYGIDEETLIENARKNLHEAVTEKYISTEKVGNCCAAIKSLLPTDLLANFYEIAVRGTTQELEQYLLKLDCRSVKRDLEEMTLFLIKSLKPETCNPVAMFIDRIGGVDPALHERVATQFDEEAPKVVEGIYDLTLPRDVFIAYRSVDMDKVAELVRYLEEREGLECFISYRNLQHGVGAREHYDEWLNVAMDNCKVLVFVSSLTSRREGDARHKELPYVKNQDMGRSPAEYQASGDYTLIPPIYKKPRVEYVIESYTSAKSEGFARDFFDGFTRRESPEAVAGDIFKILDSRSVLLRGKTAPHTTKSAPDKRGEAIIKRAAEGIKQEDEAAKMKEEDPKAEEVAHQVEELRKKKETKRVTSAPEPDLPSDYPALKNYDKSEFLIDGEALVKYEGKGGDVKIPFGVTSIGRHAFWGCSRLTSVVIPNSVTSIGRGAFADCSGLTSVVIPNSVTSIGDNAFSNCSRLTIYCEAKSKPLGWGKLGDASVVWGYTPPSAVMKNESAEPQPAPQSVSVAPKTKQKTEEDSLEPKTKSEPGTDLPSDYPALKNYDKSEFLIEGEALVKYKGEGGDVKIPFGVTSIGEEAFRDCDELTSVVIPDGVTSIGEEAFCGCNSLTSVVIPDSVTSIGGWAFCRSGLEHVEVAKENPVYRSENNCVIERRSNTLILGCKNSIIPNSVTSIGKYAFDRCRGLTSIVIPNSVTSIGDGAFCGCNNLTSVVIPDSVTSIGRHAFWVCSRLTSVVIPNSVTSIGSFAFCGCNNLTSVVIPDSVTSIGRHAFWGCSRLTSVVIPNSVTSIGDGAFCGCNNLTIYCGAKKAVARQWDRYWNLDHRKVVWGYQKSQMQ